MAKVLVSEENLTNIANAIREKNGETTTYKPNEMAGAIQNISSGSLTITENGTYDVTNYASANVNVPEKQLGTKTITVNGLYKATDDNLDGYSEVSVKTSGVDINDYLYENFKLIGGQSTNASNIKQIIKTVEISQVGSNDLGYALYNTNIEKIIFKETVDTSNVTNMNDMFSFSMSLKEITGLENLNTSNVTNMDSMFYFTALPEIDISMWDTSNVNSIYNMFAHTEAKIINISGLSFEKMTNIMSLFGFSKVETIIGFDGTSTSNVENMAWAFYCTNLKNLPQINCESANNISNMLQWSGDMALTSIGGLLNLGKGYDITKPENFSNYSLKLDYCPLLTHDSLMNVINGLYDIASKGVKPQQLVLGSTNLSKLTADEIAIATNKGWTVS